MTIGERLVELRESFSFTQLQVAEAVGVDVKTIRRYEHDEHEPDSQVIAALSKLYSVSADDIIFRFSQITQLRLHILKGDCFAPKINSYRLVRDKSIVEPIFVYLSTYHNIRQEYQRIVLKATR